jgi:hypothetical protein
MGTPVEQGSVQAGRDQAWKRRGILAAAAGVLAGIMAKQTAQPVAAAANMQFADTTTSVTNTANGPTLLLASDTGYNGAKDSVFTAQTITSGAMAGIQGVTGLKGPSPFLCGVFGYCGTSDSIGVFGDANSGFPSKGVFGRSESNGYGVVGQAISGVGVQGIIPSTNGTQPNTATNTIAVLGSNQSTGAGGIALQGVSTNGLGASVQGGLAPLRLVPGILAASALTPTGHQVGELYLTSDNQLFLFDGSHWRQVLLSPLPGTTTTVGPPPKRGTPPRVSGAASAGTQGETVTSGVQPAPPTRP